jgi:hypothetical protein
MTTCIQCGAEVDFLADTFTLYQVSGTRYLYCATCQNPLEPYIRPEDVDQLREQLGTCQEKLKRSHKIWLSLLVIGFAAIWFFVGS